MFTISQHSQPKSFTYVCRTYKTYATFKSQRGTITGGRVSLEGLWNLIKLGYFTSFKINTICW